MIRTLKGLKSKFTLSLRTPHSLPFPCPAYYLADRRWLTYHISPFRPQRCLYHESGWNWVRGTGVAGIHGLVSFNCHNIWTHFFFTCKVFPDWFQKNTQQWWTDALRNWSAAGVEFSGIWLDMNEASSFCDGSWSVFTRFLFTCLLTSLYGPGELTAEQEPISAILVFPSSFRANREISC